MIYLGVLAVSMRKYVYAVFDEAQTVPFPPLSRIRLSGGNRTAYSTSAYGYARMVIDKAGQAGYLTAA